jgi:uncharacterized protein (TIGR00369 family)
MWPGDPFETVNGPFYFRTEADGSAHGVFVPAGKHMNGLGIIHGGAMLTFADSMAASIVHLTLNGQNSVTVTLNAEFVGVGGPDAPIEATGRVVRASASMVFVQGLLEQSDQPILAFSSALKKTAPS